MKNDSIKNRMLLGVKGKKVLTILHLLLAGCIFGSSITILIIMKIKGTLPPDTQPFLMDLVMYRLFAYGVNCPLFAILFTGMIYGAFTQWGFFKHFWILTKWILALAIFVIIWFWLGMGINGMVSLSETGKSIESLGELYHSYRIQAERFMTLKVVCLTIIFAVSTWKPWGKIKPMIQLKQRTVVIMASLLIISAVISGWMNVSMLNRYRSMAIADTDLSKLEDKTYRGSAKCGNFTYETQAIIKNNQITELSVLKNRDSPYAIFAEGVFAKILKKQTPNVDAITGATTTSKCLMKAVEQTLTP